MADLQSSRLVRPSRGRISVRTVILIISCFAGASAQVRSYRLTDASPADVSPTSFSSCHEYQHSLLHEERCVTFSLPARRLVTQ